MSSNEPGFETLNLRFRAEESAGLGGLPGGWIPWTVGGVLAGVMLSTVSFWFVKSELTSALLADDPSRAMLALESISQLESDYAKTILPGISNPNYEIATASMKAFQEILDMQVDASLQAEVNESLQLLLSLPEDIPADSQALVTDALLNFQSKHREKEEALPEAFELVSGFLQSKNLLQALPETSLTTTNSPASISIDEPTARISDSASVPPPLDNPTDGEGNDISTLELPLVEPQKLSNQQLNVLPAVPAGPVSQPYGSNPTTQQYVATDNGIASQQNEASLNGQARQFQYQQPIEAVPQQPTRNYTETISRQPNFTSPDSLPGSGKLNDFQAAEPLTGGAPQIARSVGNGNRMVLSGESMVGGLETRNDRQVVKLLASGNGEWRKAAALELRTRGWNDFKLQLASELATGSELRRRELVERLARSMDLDPKFWLLWMAEEAEPSVRRLSVSLLSSMVDTDVERALRLIARRETDESVRKAISKTLLASASARAAR